MARRKRRGGRRGFRIGKYANMLFKGLGLAIVAGPAIEAAWIDFQAGRPADIPKHVLYRYTGVTDAGALDTAQTAKGLGAIFGGLLIAKLGGWISRRF